VAVISIHWKICVATLAMVPFHVGGDRSPLASIQQPVDGKAQEIPTPFAESDL
jgi:hypothetical protein